MASAVINVAPEGNLSRYLQEIRKFPMLSPEEELALSKRWRDHQDMEAAHKLVTSHLRLVAKIAMGYRGYGLPVGELISEGNVGMMQAVKRFDPDRGFRLATYAMWWIRAAIQEYILHSLVAGEDGHHRRPEEAVLQPAPAEGPDAGDRRRRPAARASGEDRPRARRARAGRGQHEPPPGGARPQPERAGSRRRARASGRTGWSTKSESQETAVADREELTGRKALLASALKTLNERERHILIERRLKDNPTTLEDLSQQYNISRERVRQIEVRAFEKLQKAMKAQIAERRLQAATKVEARA